MIELKDIVGWGIAIVIAILGVSKIVFHSKNSSKKEHNTVNQNVDGDNNVLAGGDVIMTQKEDNKHA